MQHKKKRTDSSYKSSENSSNPASHRPKLKSLSPSPQSQVPLKGERKETVKATVLAATYNQPEDTITVEYQDEGGVGPEYMHWPRSQFGPNMGVKPEFIPPGGIPIKMLTDWLPTLVGKPFEHIRVYVSIDDDMEIVKESIANDARNFKYALDSGNYKPSIQPDRTTL